MDAFETAAARRLGLNRNDLRALNLLEHGPVSQAAIADFLRLTRPSVTTMVDRLELAGLVRRNRTGPDRRVTTIELLPSTWQAFAQVYQPLGAQVRELAASWSAEQQGLVAAALSDLSTIFESAAYSDRP